eukprot:COSAG06_NODE_8_length_37897_cov_42.611884_39_plen_97_part_01
MDGSEDDATSSPPTPTEVTPRSRTPSDAPAELEEALLDAAYEGDGAALGRVLAHNEAGVPQFDVNAVDGTGATAFVVACMSDERAELIQPLLDAGCA